MPHSPGRQHRANCGGWNFGDPQRPKRTTTSVPDSKVSCAITSSRPTLTLSARPTLATHVVRDSTRVASRTRECWRIPRQLGIGLIFIRRFLTRVADGESSAEFNQVENKLSLDFASRAGDGPDQEQVQRPASLTASVSSSFRSPRSRKAAATSSQDWESPQGFGTSAMTGRPSR